ncbi:MAG: alpha/beta hydrolase fold domain-containing protein [Planctomycetales bacterium]|nr:alpha/beta hydrolase fold domain-containing protein [Planctomycetales bacterium]
MRSAILATCFACIVSQSVCAAPRPTKIMLWNDKPPGAVAVATEGADDGTGRYWDVGVPSMWVYEPDLPPPPEGRVALIACCGGGYSHLTRLVGADGAVDALLPRNIVVVALRYRPSPPSPAGENDSSAGGARAVQLLRAHAAQWHVNPDKIGLFGWSAGGNLALNAASRPDQAASASDDPVARTSSRPNFVAMLSPWPGRPPRPIEDYPISPDAPPAFIASAEDDETAPVTFARSIAQAYAKADVPYSLWTPASGGHGAFTIGAPGEGGQWVGRFIEWFESLDVGARSGTSASSADRTDNYQTSTREYKRTDAQSLLLDVCAPSTLDADDSAQRRPVVVVVHGGGWGSGDRKTMIEPALEVLRTCGYVYVSMDYRLVPPNTWHDCYADVTDAIGWTKSHIVEFGGDPSRMAILGYSAGGQLAFMAGLRESDLVQFKAMVGLAPATDLLEDLGRRGGITPHMKAVMGHNVDSPLESFLLKMYSASPINHVHPDMPPVLLIHGTEDRSVPFAQSEQFQLKVTDAKWGVSCDIYRVHGAGHRQSDWEKYDAGYKRKLEQWLKQRL